MNRADKAAFIEELTQTFKENPHVIMTRYSGLTVNQDRELRHQVREVGGRYRVIKNRLARIAAKGSGGAEELSEQFSGPIGIAVHPDDPVSLAKALTKFAKDNPQVEVVAGVVDAKAVVDSKGVEQLSKLPGIDELRAKIVGMINTPATTLVRLLGTPGTQLARVVDARRESLGDGGAEAEG